MLDIRGASCAGYPSALCALVVACFHSVFVYISCSLEFYSLYSTTFTLKQNMSSMSFFHTLLASFEPKSLRKLLDPRPLSAKVRHHLRLPPDRQSDPYSRPYCGEQVIGYRWIMTRRSIRGHCPPQCGYCIASDKHLINSDKEFHTSIYIHHLSNYPHPLQSHRPPHPQP